MQQNHQKPAQNPKLPTYFVSEYAKRNENVRKLGFKDYAQYLNSSLWADIRKRHFQTSGFACYGCGNRAYQVHHRHYDLSVLNGQKLDGLVSLCDTCHRKIEFNENGEKDLCVESVNFKLEHLHMIAVSNNADFANKERFFDRVKMNAKKGGKKKRREKSPKPDKNALRLAEGALALQLATDRAFSMLTAKKVHYILEETKGVPWQVAEKITAFMKSVIFSIR